MAQKMISKKRKFVADGVFYAELNEVRRPVPPLSFLSVSRLRMGHEAPQALRRLTLTCTQFLIRELAEEGYAGVEVRVTPIRTEIIIRATRTQNVLGEKGRRIRELTSVVQKR